jgi:hypothetical protein
MNKVTVPDFLTDRISPNACFPTAHASRGNLSSEHGEPGTRLRVREAPTTLPVEGATGYPCAGVPVMDYNVKDGRLANSGQHFIPSLTP